MVQCASCGESYSKREKHCPKCGSKLVRITEGVQRECDHCGAINSFDASICIRCKLKI
jgi:ribosomal protein L40E